MLTELEILDPEPSKFGYYLGNFNRFNSKLFRAQAHIYEVNEVRQSVQLISLYIVLTHLYIN